MPKTIVIPVTLDTKGEETAFIKELIQAKGHSAFVIDVGVLGQPQIRADITREEVAAAGGGSLPVLVEAAIRGADRTEATNVMALGLRKIVADLHSTSRLDGILSLGGTTGTALGTQAMSILPIGVPKLMVSTGFELQFVGHKDIAILQTPADILGLNSVMRQTLASAAGAIVGMVEADAGAPGGPLVGMTALGVTTPAVMKLVPLLRGRGYDPISFHTDTQILTELVEQDRVDGIIDVTTFEVMIPLAFHLPEALAEARLALAGERGLPQVIVPGGLDMFIFPGTKETIPEEYRDRAIHVHGPDIVLIRTDKEEVARAGRMLADRANQATGPTAFVIPARGFSAVDAPGQHFHDPEADAAFARVVKDTARDKVQIIEVDAHINDDEFADAVVEAFDALVRRAGA